MRYAANCTGCLNKVASWGEPVLAAYQLVCNAYAQTGNPLVIDISEKNKNLLQCIAFLEMKGYLFSFETANEVMAKPSVYEASIEGTEDTWCYFCPDGSKKARIA
jgi:hypothetical protein